MAGPSTNPPLDAESTEEKGVGWDSVYERLSAQKWVPVGLFRRARWDGGQPEKRMAEFGRAGKPAPLTG